MNSKNKYRIGTIFEVEKSTREKYSTWHFSDDWDHQSLASSKRRMKENPMNALCNPYCWFYLNEEILRFILRCGVDNDSYEREYILYLTFF